MLQREVFPKYKQYCSELNEVYSIMKQYFSPTSFEDLCRDRGYPIGETCQYDLIKEMNLGYLEISDTSIFNNFSKELGLFSEKGHFLLNNRYIIPVYSISGDLVSLIGYFPDKKKICNFKHTILF